MIFTAINVGTNSTKALFVRINDAGWEELSRELEVTGLGEGLASGCLSEAAMVRTEQAIMKLVEQGKKLGSSSFWLTGTQALRQAANSQEFQRRLAQRNLKLQILTGDQEAALSFAGITSNFSASTPILAFDLGAGSLELMAGQNKLDKAVSLPLGAGLLTENFFNSDPPAPAERQALENYIADILKEYTFPGYKLLIGVGGTVTVLCQLALSQREYSRDFHGEKLAYSTVLRLYREISSLSLNQRTSLPGLENPRRAKIAVAGVGVVKKLMEIYQAPELIVSEAGILDGMIEAVCAGEQLADHRIRTVLTEREILI
jgi:exopolyphosphatase/guanosine-5'-triphosphate,3'-diphosphate pyrophosphatase